MRDNKEVIRVILEVERVWKNHRDLRLGQLLVNAAGEAERESDIFYIEDNDLLNYLREFNRRYGKDGDTKVAKRKKSSRKGKTTRKETR